MAAPRTEKLLVIGLDGAGYPYLRPLLAAGELPTLGALAAAGSMGGLDSTEIILTPVAWSTSYTGKNPAAHGICGFTRRRPGTYRWGYVSPADRTSKEYWRLLEDQGFHSVLVGPIFCRKNEDFGGVYVGGEYCGELARNVQPESLLETVAGQFQYQPVSPCRTLEEVEVFVRRKFDLARHLLATHPWNLGFVGFMEPDLLHHRNDPQFALEGYRILDRLLGEFLAALPAPVPVMIYSDHGHRSCDRAFHVNSWLCSRGYLAKKKPREALVQRWREVREGMAQVADKLDGPAERLFYPALYGARGLVRSLPPLHRTLQRFFPDAALPNKARPLVFGEQFADGAQPGDLNPGLLLDYSRTKAYAYLNRGGNIAGICINRRGRDPEGVVDDAEYEDFRTELALALGQLREPLGGGPLVRRVWKREELYTGEHAEDFPDLLFEIDEGYYTYISEDNIDPRHLFIDLRDSQHAREGVLICSGPGFVRQPDHQGPKPSLLDVAPTLLYALDAAIPADLEGRVLGELFTAEYRDTRPEVWSDQESRTSRGEGYSSDEEQLIAARLRGLGYIE
ncbi:MAG: alkaline phosphatase family protein [Candidatus Latescibacteria bacterium]|nr:alkaline phosphatase family protein [Candidatus Latescibacterota bacterium]